MTDGNVEFGAFDLMLLGVFFISYNVLGLVQIAMLFGRRFIVFASLTAAALLAAQGFAWFDYAEFCVEPTSAIVCGRDQQGLTGMGMVWVYVSAAMLAMFGLNRLVRKRSGAS